MKIELSEKEVELIGRDRWGQAGGVKWRRWLFFSALLWIAVGFATVMIPQAVRITLIFVTAVPFIACLVLWNRDSIRAGRAFLKEKKGNRKEV